MKIYYHNDLDGRCAGAIAYREARDWRGAKIELIELDYKDRVDVEKIGLGEPIVIVDFSFNPEVMKRVLQKTTHIIWIDHHKTAFEYNYYRELKGLRDKNFSGCELTWKYFVPDTQIPHAVELIGDRDKWAWKYGEHTANFNMGLKIYDHQPRSIIWDELFPFSTIPFLIGYAGNDPHQKIQKIEKEGEICLKFRDSFCEDYCNSYGFETEFGNYKCFALGIYMFGSEAFGDRMKKYDICLSYEFVGDSWIVGLYSIKDIDVSKIAQKYGGGGHTKAAGFVCRELPFKKHIM